MSWAGLGVCAERSSESGRYRKNAIHARKHRFAPSTFTHNQFEMGGRALTDRSGSALQQRKLVRLSNPSPSAGTRVISAGRHVPDLRAPFAVLQGKSKAHQTEAPERFVVSSEHAVADAAPERPAGPRPASSAPAGAPQAAPEPPEELARRLGSDALDGLPDDPAAIAERRARGGANADGTLRILVAAAGVSIAVSLATQGPPAAGAGAPPGVEEVQAEAARARGRRRGGDGRGAARGGTPWVDGVSILGAVALVSAVTAANNYTKEAQFRALNRVKNDRRARVVRGGAPASTPYPRPALPPRPLPDAGVQVQASELVVPADGVLVAGLRLEADESGSRARATPSRRARQPPPPRRHPERDDERKTPLQKKPRSRRAIGRVGLAAAVLTVAALCVRWASTSGRAGGAGRDGRVDAALLLHHGVTILVMAVPEGLPVRPRPAPAPAPAPARPGCLSTEPRRSGVTVSLAYSVRAMLADQVPARPASSPRASRAASDADGRPQNS
eukprot:tig00020604_g11869.t1